MSFDHGDDNVSRAWLPIVPEVCGDDGGVRAGAVATLVDTVGGGLAAAVTQPDWIATADLSLHLTAAPADGSVVATARVLRAGRTTVVLEVALEHEGDSNIGLSTMSFSVLPRRDTNPDIGDLRSSGPSTMALPSSALDGPYLEQLGVRVVDAAAGVVEVPVTEWSSNSMGAFQGGAVAAILEAAGEAALRAATGEPLVVTDLQITFLAFGRIGPLRTCAADLEAGDGFGTARVVLTDAGTGREMTIGRVVATRSLR